MASIANWTVTLGTNTSNQVTVAVRYDLSFQFNDRHLNPFFQESVSLRRQVGFQDAALTGQPDRLDAPDVTIALLANQFFRPSDAGMPETAHSFALSRSIDVTLTGEESDRLREGGATKAYVGIHIRPDLPTRFSVNVDAVIPGSGDATVGPTIARLPADLNSFIRLDPRIVSAIIRPPVKPPA